MCAILLLLILTSWDIEINQGPTSINNLEFGCYNVRSAAHKAASLHDIIHDNKLSLLALSETWIPGDAPAIAQDIAPDGFGVLHSHRTNTAGGQSRGGGLALVYDKRMFTAQPVKLKPVALFSAFEVQLVKITSGRKLFLIPTVIFRVVRIIFWSALGSSHLPGLHVNRSSHGLRRLELPWSWSEHGWSSFDRNLRDLRIESTRETGNEGEQSTGRSGHALDSLREESTSGWCRDGVGSPLLSRCLWRRLCLQCLWLRGASTISTSRSSRHPF